jgi:hypothetical protein
MRSFSEFVAEASTQWTQAKPGKFFGGGNNFEVLFNNQTHKLTLTDKDYQSKSTGKIYKEPGFTGTVVLQLTPEQAEIMNRFITFSNDETREPAKAPLPVPPPPGVKRPPSAPSRPAWFSGGLRSNPPSSVSRQEFTGE